MYLQNNQMLPAFFDQEEIIMLKYFTRSPPEGEIMTTSLQSLVTGQQTPKSQE